METTSKIKVQDFPPVRLPKGYHFSTGNTALYRPRLDQKGIRCEGNRFDYIVPWQVNEKTNQSFRP
jgi:hypothetical protein